LEERVKLSIDDAEFIFTDYDGKTICLLLTEEGLILSTPRFNIEWQEFRDGVGTLLIPFTRIDERAGEKE
jgi:hypothetical protein